MTFRVHHLEYNQELRKVMMKGNRTFQNKFCQGVDKLASL